VRSNAAEATRLIEYGIARSGLSGLILLSGISISLSAWPFRRRKPDDETPEHSDQDDAASDQKVDLIDWGIRLAMLGKLDRAVEQFKSAVEQEPDNPIAHYNFALALDELGRYEEARQAYERAAYLSPESIDILINSSITLLSLDKRDDAIGALNKAVEKGCDDPIPHFDLGCAYLTGGAYKEAIYHFREAAKVDPKDPQTRFNLAIALRKAGFIDQAENELRDFLALARARFPEHRLYVERLLAEEYSNKEN